MDVSYGWFRTDFRLINNQIGRQNGTRNTVKWKFLTKMSRPKINRRKFITVKDGIEKVIEFSFRTNNQTLKDFLDERGGTDKIKMHHKCQRTIYNALKKRSPLLTDHCTPPKVLNGQL